VRLALRQATTVELIAIFLVAFLKHEKLVEIVPKLEVKHLLFNIYQNFLIIIRYALLRLPLTEGNPWVKKLHTTIKRN
jgi:hypothetical protein